MTTVTAAEGMIYLVACGLHQTEPDSELLAEMDFFAVYNLAKQHSLAALSWYGLGNSAKLMPEPLRRKWKNRLYASMKKNALMDAERERFFAFCESAGIRYMPLKGIILQTLYPFPGTREMADNDILFDVSRDIDVRDYFCANGWSVEAFQLGNHDTYHKPPFYNFELHRSLIGEYEGRTWDSYYEQPFQRTIPDGKSRFGYQFREEDFYAYIMLHAYKHYIQGGTGLRNLVDCYLCRHAMSLERQQLDRELEKLNIPDYERESAQLSDRLFGDPAKTLDEMRNMSEGLKKTLDYYLSSGTYGTMEHQITNAMRKIAPEEENFSAGTRFRYMWKNVFPGKKHMQAWCKANAPFFTRHEWLLWAAPFYRLIYKGATATKMLRHRLMIIWKR